MLMFLAKTEKTRKIRSENRTKIARKKSKIAAGNCYSQFPIHNSNNDRTVLSLAKDDCKWSRSKLEWTRANLRWKGGQLKLPNGPDQKLVS